VEPLLAMTRCAKMSAFARKWHFVALRGAIGIRRSWPKSANLQILCHKTVKTRYA
jgi:hypothetical protein